MSSDEEQQAVKPSDDDDEDFQLNPIDDQNYQSDNENDNDNSSQGNLKQEGENFVNKLIKGMDSKNSDDENETTPDDEQEKNDDDQESKPDDDNQGTTPDEKKEEKNDENDQKEFHSENAITPYESDEIDNENNEGVKANTDDKQNKKENDKKNKKSNNHKKLHKASANMINQLINADDEHQVADEIHTKSSNDEDDVERESSENKDDDDESEKSDSDDDSNKSESDDESKKSESDDERKKNESDDESKKNDSDDESEKSESDDERKKKESDDENSNSDSNKENKEESDDDKSDSDKLDDDFEDEGDNEDPNTMITVASNVIKPPKEPRERPGRKKPRLAPQPVYSDEEIIDQITNMMKDKKLPESSYHQPIRNYISREQLKASEQHDYRRAEILESYLDMLTDLLNQVDNSEQEEERRRIIESKIQKVNEQHQEFVRRWNKEWNDKTQEQEKTKKTMEERQDLEIKDFKLRCSEDAFIQRFNKPSQTLINLRKAENQMAMAKLFDRAKILKKKADQLQKIEQIEAQNRMNEAVLTQYQLMDDRHQRERECFDQHNQSIFDTLEKKKDKEQRSYELSLSMLKAQLDPPPNKDKVELVKPQTAKRPIRNNRTINDIRSPAALEIQTVDFTKFTRTRKIIKPTTASSTRKSMKK